MSVPTASAANIAAIHRLTATQEGILYHSLESQQSDVYITQFSCELRGRLDVGSYRNAWQRVIERHAAMRTLFSWERRDNPLQIVRAEVDVPFTLHDWSSKDSAALEEAWSTLKQQDRERGFDLTKAPLLRIVLIRVQESIYRLLFSFHHIVLDGWSMRRLFAESLQFYEAMAADGELALPDPPDFGRYVDWLQQQDVGAGNAFFHDMLSGFATPTFPDFRNETGTLGVPGSATCVRCVDEPVTMRLQRAAGAARVTLNTLVVAAWSYVLHRYTGAGDVVFGTTVSGRSSGLNDAHDIAGMCINTLPLRVAIPESGAIGDWLRDIQQRQTTQRAFEFMSLADVSKLSDVPTGAALFESILVYENFPATAAQGNMAATIDIANEEYAEFSHYPLAVLIVPERELQLIGVFDSQRLNRMQTESLLRHLRNALESLVVSIESGELQLEIFDEQERSSLLQQQSGPTIEAANVACVHAAFDDVAGQYPDALAVVDADLRMTYRELNQQANGIARDLMDLDVSTGSIVAICLERSAIAIAAMLAVLKTGAAYVPFDASAPAERSSGLLEDIGSANSALDKPTVVITDAATESAIVADDLKRYRIDGSQPGSSNVAQVSSLVPPSSPAYVMYTSGSSGTPKGVLVSHANLLHSTRARFDYYQKPVNAFLLLSSLATDSSIAGIYWSLLSGATLVLPRGRQEQDVAEVCKLIVRHGVSHILCVPSLYRVMLELGDAAALTGLDAIIVAGEACPHSLVEAHSATLPGVDIYNEYGPTEATVWATASRLDASRPVSIGRPIANTSALVLDDGMRFLPKGVAGELCIGGDGVALGYLNDQRRSDDKFVPDPYSPGSGARLYRSGDRACYQADGEIEFLGRIDNQLKIRGFRVEPEEIEAAIRSFPAVESAAVYLDQQERLAACVTTSNDVASLADDLKAHLRQRLPEHMVPQVIGRLAAMPLTAAGKLDRAAVASLHVVADANNAVNDQIVAPRNDIERQIAAAWSEVLGTDELSVFDDFFEMGGDSLLSIRILARLGAKGVRIAPNEFFANPSIAAQAGCVRVAADDSTAAEEVQGLQPLSPIQAWFFDNVRDDRQQWNLCRLYQLQVSLDSTTIEKVVAELLARHDALRLVFVEDESLFGQQVGDVKLTEAIIDRDFSDLNEADLQRQVDAFATELNRNFELACGPLIRFGLVRTAPDVADRLLICAHHLIIDALSFELLIDEFDVACDQLMKDRPIELPTTAASPLRWLQRLITYGDAMSENAREYWMRASQRRCCELPEDAGAEKNSAVTADTLIVCLDKSSTENLLHNTRSAYRTEIREILMAALSATLCDWRGSSSITVDTEGHGREMLFDDVDVSRSVGWFTTVFPVTLECRDPNDSRATIIDTKEIIRAIPNNGIGYGVMRDLCDNAESAILKAAPRAQVLFNYLGSTDDAENQRPILRLEQHHVGECRSPRVPPAYALEVNASLDNGQLQTAWQFDTSRFSDKAVRALANAYLHKLHELLEHCLQHSEGEATPSDFPMADLDADGLAEIAKMLGEDVTVERNG